MAHESSKWTDALPVVLLGIRSALKADIGATVAELLYGTPLKLPADIISPDTPRISCESFVSQLKTHMANLKPLATSAHSTEKIFIHPELKECTHIFLRFDANRPPLRQPYSGPYKVLEKHDKTLVIDIQGRKSTVSIDRVKPAYILQDEPLQKSSIKPVQSRPSQTPSSSATANNKKLETTSKKDQTVTTRSGRHVHFPKRLVTIM
ncbi:uncharacterized protein [Centruroides vittatus]|uniref:uncharacterized protein n=1 Tax=Centruroides vittatus TaxID=120091 RepID=UPI003510475A